MTIRIFPTLWDREMHALNGAPDHRKAAMALAESGYQVVVFHIDKKVSDTAVAVSFDTDDEGLAVAWLFPGVDDEGPMQ